MLAYPITLSPTGSLLLSEDIERDRIRLLLDTLYWERVMIPDFGNPITNFDPIDGSGDLISSLSLALSYWVGDSIEVLDVSDLDSTERGVLQIQIKYGNGTGIIDYSIDRSQLATTNLGT